MTTKFISLATAIVLLDVYLRSQLSSNDPLFLFASSNLWINSALLIIVGLMVGISFHGRFKHWWSFAGCATAAVVFGVLGFIGTFFSEVFYNFPQILYQLDYMFLMEASVVFGICALSYQHEPMPFSVRPPRLSIPKIELPVPKIPHSPGRTLSSRN
jgi:hypothetical protein